MYQNTTSSAYDAIFCFSPYAVIGAMPLAPALLKGICDEAGLKTTTLDLNLEFQMAYKDKRFADEITNFMMYGSELSDIAKNYYNDWLRNKAQELLDINATWIGLSLLTYQSIKFSTDLCYYIKLIDPKQKIIVGGQGACNWENTGKTYKHDLTYGDTILRTGLADAMVVNESETMIVDLIKNNKLGKHDLQRQLTEDELNDLAVPQYADYKIQSYQTLTDIYGVPSDSTTATITGSKGCVRKCTFCDVYSFEPIFKYKSGDKIADEIISIYEQHGIKDFFFSDSLINGSMKSFRQMNEVLAKRLPKTIKYSGEYIAKPKHQTTKEDYHMMSEAGCKRLQIGIESGSESVRTHMRKKFTNDDIHDMAINLYDNNIEQSWNIMIGYPTETDKDFMDTLDLVTNYSYMKFPLLSINPTSTLVILPGTPLYDELKDELEISWLDTNALSPGVHYQFWQTGINNENNLKIRLNRWKQLIKLCEQHGYITNKRSKAKTDLANKTLEHYNSLYDQPNS